MTSRLLSKLGVHACTKCGLDIACMSCISCSTHQCLYCSSLLLDGDAVPMEMPTKRFASKAAVYAQLYPQAETAYRECTPERHGEMLEQVNKVWSETLETYASLVEAFSNKYPDRMERYQQEHETKREEQKARRKQRKEEVAESSDEDPDEPATNEPVAEEKEEEYAPIPEPEPEPEIVHEETTRPALPSKVTHPVARPVTPPLSTPDPVSLPFTAMLAARSNKKRDTDDTKSVKSTKSNKSTGSKRSYKASSTSMPSFGGGATAPAYSPVLPESNKKQKRGISRRQRKLVDVSLLFLTEIQSLSPDDRDMLLKKLQGVILHPNEEKIGVQEVVEEAVLNIQALDDATNPATPSPT